MRTAIQRFVLRRLRATVALIAILALCWPGNARACPGLMVVNALPRSSVCPLGNTVSIFPPGQGQQVIQPEGKSSTSAGTCRSSPGWAFR